MKTHEEIALNVKNQLEAERKIQSEKKRKIRLTVVPVACCAVVLASAFGIMNMNQFKAPQTEVSYDISASANTKAALETYGTGSSEGITEIATEKSGSKENPKAEMTEIAPCSTSVDYENSDNKAKDSAGKSAVKSAATEDSTVTGYTTAVTESRGGAMSVSSQYVIDGIKNDSIGWIKYNGVYYWQDSFAGTHHNGKKIEPEKFLGNAEDFEGNYRNNDIGGKVYTTNYCPPEEELMIVLDNGSTVFLWAFTEGEIE